MLNRLKREKPSLMINMISINETYIARFCHSLKVQNYFISDELFDNYHLKTWEEDDYVCSVVEKPKFIIILNLTIKKVQNKTWMKSNIKSDNVFFNKYWWVQGKDVGNLMDQYFITQKIIEIWFFNYNVVQLIVWNMKRNVS